VGNELETAECCKRVEHLSSQSGRGKGSPAFFFLLTDEVIDDHAGHFRKALSSKVSLGAESAKRTAE